MMQESEPVSADAEYYEESGLGRYRFVGEVIYDRSYTYAGWKDMMIYGGDIYKKENGEYRKTSKRICDLFGMTEETWKKGQIGNVKQFENKLITLDKESNRILICDLNTTEVSAFEPYENNILCGYDWWVLDGIIYYAVEKDVGNRILVCMEIETGISERILSLSERELEAGRVLSYSMALRDDASIVTTIYDNPTDTTEYWIGYMGKDGKRQWECAMKTDEYLYDWIMQFNRSGVFVWGEFPAVKDGCKDDIICIGDNGTISRPIFHAINEMIMTDEGYYVCEYVPGLESVTYEGMNDGINCVTFYDYEANMIGRYPFKEKIRDGYRFETMLQHEERMILFFENERKESIWLLELVIE